MPGPDRFDLKAPCKTCPFRTDGSQVLLSEDRREEIAAGIEGGATFTCHKTVDYSVDDEERDGGTQCAGAVLVAGQPQLMRIYDRFGEGLPYDVVHPEPHDAVPWEDPWEWAYEAEGL